MKYRECPNCGKPIFYQSDKGYKNAVMNNANCKHCSNLLRDYKTPSGKGHPRYGEHHSEESISKMRQNAIHLYGEKNPFYGKTHSKDVLKKISKANKGKVLSDETKEKLSKVRRGVKKSNEHRRKLRIARIQYIQNNFGICFPCFSSKACKYLDKLNKENGWELEHALRVGEFRIKELGYWLDGYDRKRNIVVEYDEPFHYKKDGSLKEKDVLKTEEVKKYLGCRFFRYNESKNELREYI